MSEKKEAQTRATVSGQIACKSLSEQIIQDFFCCIPNLRLIALADAAPKLLSGLRRLASGEGFVAIGVIPLSDFVPVKGQMEREVSSVKGDWLCYYPHALGIILGTGFKEFVALCGIHGLAKEYGETIEILAVSADNPGTGQLRNFIAGLKDSFAEIFVWEVWNPDLKRTLKRYGFHGTSREDADETLTGFRWKAPSVPSGNDSSSASSSPKSAAVTPTKGTN